MENGKALLIIDMQNESFPPGAPSYDMEGVVTRINALSTKFRAAGLPVILVQHDGTLQGEYVPGTPGWELIPGLTVSPGDIRIGKTANDTFYETELQTILDQRQVNELFITGSATDFCIDSSIQSALTKNYIVTVVRDGHTTGERAHLSAEKIVEHYNWVWRNLNPTKGRIVMKRAGEIEV